ncbi:MAG TPA: hypothetical protein VJK30_02265 [Coxiellaceae bacterium]|nr:MAG: hypothetical protein A3E81_03675 [Gammaproteobacteria bacterium RIFCSPHIGHO2_12_FULL_36_30]HLB56145.1 hypothetical protein [Coxiellaceae bacterium]
MKKTIFVLLCILSFNAVFADQGAYTYSKSGNIFFYSEKMHQVLQLTHSDKNNHPTLSPNGRWLAFIKRGNHIMPGHCGDFADTGSNYGDEIWIADLKTMQIKRLVKNNFHCDHPTKMIVDPKDLSFSPDNRTLYFETSAWVTSGAIHAVNVDGKYLQFVTDGGEYRIVRHGVYTGDLIVNQHRYRFKGNTPLGSCNWDWLFTSQGKQIKLYSKHNEFS